MTMQTAGVLAGFVPATRGRRIGSRAIDVALGAATVLIPVLVAGGSSDPLSALMAASVLYLGLSSLFAIASLIALFTRSATLGQALCGLQQVNMHTGRRAPGSTFAKLLLESLVSTLTLGLGLIASATTIRAPLNQNWLDRAMGLVVIDTRRGPRAGQSATPQTTAASATPSSDPVPVVLPAAAVPASRSGSVPLYAEMTDLAAPAQRVELAMTTSPESRRVGQVAADPVIQGTPWGPPSAAPSVVPVPTHRSAPVASFAPPAQGGDSASATQAVDIAGNDHDHDHQAPIPQLQLDNGTVVVLDRPAVLGRDPLAPQALPQARLVTVPDLNRSISKTHLVVGRDADGVWVRDLGSTNGVTVRAAAGETRAVIAGERHLLSGGDTVSFGARSFRLVHDGGVHDV